jgi:glycosyltransferase involved in cell wall biosynthesis
MPGISVIIPTYNSAHYLGEAIKSVLAQTYKDLEIIVIDDGSTDNTKEIVKTYADRIIFLQQANSGPAKARNFGIQKSSGEFVAFLDADDVWYPEKLERQMEMFLKNPQYGLIHSDALIRTVDNSQPDRLWFDFKRRNKSGMVFSDLLAECFIILSSAIIRRQCLEETGCFDENVVPWEGYDLWLRVTYSYPIGFVNAPLFVRRLHSSNLFYSNFLYENLSLIKIMEKWEEKTLSLSKTDKEIVKNNLRRQYFRLGIYYLAQCDPENTRVALRKSLERRVSLDGVTYYGLAMLPAFVLRLGRKIKRRLRFRTVIDRI